MSRTTDTRIEDTKDAEFPATGARCIWGPTDGSLMYTPSEAAKKWDGAEWANAAIGSRFGGFSYAELKITGRKLTKSPTGSYGVRCRITTNKDTGDERTWGAWMTSPEITDNYSY